MQLPSVDLPATDGRLINPALHPGLILYFIYPYTGRPDVADPPGWDDIPGAHGSTPQARAYATHQKEFMGHAAEIFGLSTQSITWQREFVNRTQLPFPLLSDAGLGLTVALGLETFAAGSGRYLRRRTLVARNGVVALDRSTIVDPASDAEEVLHWLKKWRP